VASQPDPVFQ